MAKYVGKRIVPLPCGEWDQRKEYEMLSVVLESSSGDSYIARRAVPAGTAITDTSYWAKSSDFSQQLQNVSDELVETLRAVRADNNATEQAIRQDNTSTKNAIVADNDATEQTITQDNANTRSHVDQVTGDALSAMNAAKQSFDQTSAALMTRMNSIAGSATEDTEILDARVDLFDGTHENLGEAVRYAEELYVNGFRPVDVTWKYGTYTSSLISNDPRRVRNTELIPLKAGQRIRMVTHEQYAGISAFRKIQDTGVLDDDYERFFGSGWQHGTYEYGVPEDAYILIIGADEPDYNTAQRMELSDVQIEVYILDNYAAQVFTELDTRLNALDEMLAEKTRNMDVSAKGDVILTNNNCASIDGYKVTLPGSQLYFIGETQRLTILFTDMKEQLGDSAELVDGGIVITMTASSTLGFNVSENRFVFLNGYDSSPDICPVLSCYYGYMYGKITARAAFRTMEIYTPDFADIKKLRTSEKGFVYIGNEGKVRIEKAKDTSGGLRISIDGGICLRFKGVARGLDYSDMVEELGDNIEIVEGKNAATITLPKAYDCLVVSTLDWKLHIRSGQLLQPEDYLLVCNGYWNKVGYLVNIETMQRLEELEETIPNYLTKAEVAEQSFNSSFHKNPVDFRPKTQQFSYLLNDLERVETFLFFTDPHLAEFTGWEDRFREYLATIQKYYNSTPTSFCMCGGDWLGNSDLPDEACFKMGYIDGVCKSLFHPYYAILGNHDTNYQGKATPESERYTTRLSTNAIRNLWYREEGNAYYGFHGSNTHFFVFDTGTESQSMQAYQWEQAKWFADGLKDNRDEHIVLATHIFYANFANQSIQPLISTILSITEAYNGRNPITVNGEEYDFADAVGHIEFILAGHSHRDAVLDTFCVPVIITINVRSGENAPSFDLCLIDYDNRQFKMVRIGDGEDRTVNF